MNQKEKEFTVGILTKFFIQIINVPHDSVLKIKYKPLCRDHVFHIFLSVLWWLTLTGNSLKVHLWV